MSPWETLLHTLLIPLGVAWLLVSLVLWRLGLGCASFLYSVAVVGVALRLLIYWHNG